MFKLFCSIKYHNHLLRLTRIISIGLQRQMEVDKKTEGRELKEREAGVL